MRFPHSAMRSLAAGALALAIAACGKDSSAPSEFNPAGTSADMSAAEDAFTSSQMSSFSALGADISVALGGSAAVQTSALAVHHAPRGATATARYARQLAALLPHQGALQAMTAAVPTSLEGTTFVWDLSSSTYVASDQSGAPSDGVRFLLYAIDPVTSRPADPLVVVGYVDLVDHSTSSTVDVQVKVVDGGTVYLQYSVTAHSTATGGVVELTGYASNGSTLANFDLKSSVTDNNGSPVIALNYHLGVPSRHLALDWSATLSNVSDTEVVVTVDFTVSGPNGTVRLVGTVGTDGGTLTVKVNGSLFATMTVTPGSDPVITGADGATLTAEEQESLESIFSFYEGSDFVFSGLLVPVG
jgi:hypothetical protein